MQGGCAAKVKIFSESKLQQDKTKKEVINMLIIACITWEQYLLLFLGVLYRNNYIYFKDVLGSLIWKYLMH